MKESPEKNNAPRRAGRQHRRARDRACHCCGRTVPFCWTCRCGFAICQDCMQDNIWGMSCNGITWHCPDCEGSNGFGNQ